MDPASSMSCCLLRTPLPRCLFHMPSWPPSGSLCLTDRKLTPTCFCPILLQHLSLKLSSPNISSSSSLPSFLFNGGRCEVKKRLPPSAFCPLFFWSPGSGSLLLRGGMPFLSLMTPAPNQTFLTPVFRHRLPPPSSFPVSSASLFSCSCSTLPLHAPFWFCSYHPTCARPTLLLIYPAFHIFDALLSGVTVRPGEYYLPALPNPVLSLFVAFGYFPVISVLVFLSLLPLSLLRFARYEFCPRLGVVSR
jgi:hypothetical protein